MDPISIGGTSWYEDMKSTYQGNLKEKVAMVNALTSTNTLHNRYSTLFS